MLSKFSSISRQTLLRLIGTILAVSLLVFLLGRQGWEEILAAIRELPPGYLILAQVLMLVSRLVVPARWHVLLRSAKVDIPYLQTLRITLAGLFASNFLPTTIGGDIIRLAGALQLKADRAITAASIVADRLVGMAGMATALVFGVQALWRWISSGMASSPDTAAVLQSLALAGWGRKAWAVGQRTIQRLLEAIQIWIRQPRALLLSLGFSWIHMLLKFGAIWLLFSGLKEPMSFSLIAGLWSITYFVTLFPVSINGLGLQEISMTFIFVNLGESPLKAVLLAALLVRFLELIASLPGAFFLPNILSGMKKQEASTDSDRVKTEADQ